MTRLQVRPYGGPRPSHAGLALLIFALSSGTHSGAEAEHTARTWHLEWSARAGAAACHLQAQLQPPWMAYGSSSAVDTSGEPREGIDWIVMRFSTTGGWPLSAGVDPRERGLSWMDWSDGPPGELSISVSTGGWTLGLDESDAALVISRIGIGGRWLPERSIDSRGAQTSSGRTDIATAVLGRIRSGKPVEFELVTTAGASRRFTLSGTISAERRLSLARFDACREQLARMEQWEPVYSPLRVGRLIDWVTDPSRRGWMINEALHQPPGHCALRLKRSLEPSRRVDFFELNFDAPDRPEFLEQTEKAPSDLAAATDKDPLLLELQIADFDEPRDETIRPVRLLIGERAYTDWLDALGGGALANGGRIVRIPVPDSLLVLQHVAEGRPLSVVVELEDGNEETIPLVDGPASRAQLEIGMFLACRAAIAELETWEESPPVPKP